METIASCEDCTIEASSDRARSTPVLALRSCSTATMCPSTTDSVISTENRVPSRRTARSGCPCRRSGWVAPRYARTRCAIDGVDGGTSTLTEAPTRSSLSNIARAAALANTIMPSPSLITIASGATSSSPLASVSVHRT